ncbi:hypothetical protein PIB30_048309 [Stylosanthes scabra]|uniref:Uncharacterized protein n=1 Tax=Stylosanthes scabra TaxID=79078 RepID=A0ABU6XH86_9FABA|nr:hypothetical protein [Stylosanthes scabra]
MGEKRPWMETKGREHRKMGLRQLFDKLPVVLGDSVDNEGGDTYALGGCYDLRSSHPHLNPCDHNRLGGAFRNYGGDDSSNLMATTTATKIKDEEETIYWKFETNEFHAAANERVQHIIKKFCRKIESEVHSSERIQHLYPLNWMSNERVAKSKDGNMDRFIIKYMVVKHNFLTTEFLVPIFGQSGAFIKVLRFILVNMETKISDGINGWVKLELLDPRGASTPDNLSRKVRDCRSKAYSK